MINSYLLLIVVVEILVALILGLPQSVSYGRFLGVVAYIYCVYIVSSRFIQNYVAMRDQLLIFLANPEIGLSLGLELANFHVVDLELGALVDF